MTIILTYCIFCRVLQKQFDEEGQGVVVNSIHPGTKHSKILQQSVIPLEVRFASTNITIKLWSYTLVYQDGAYAIANCACVPDKGLRGEVLWHNLTPIKWEASSRGSILNSAAFKVN